MISSQELNDLSEQIRTCIRCPLHLTRGRAIPGAGNPQARIVLVGQGPGEHEDAAGIPFVGPAGDLLNHLLTTFGVERRDLWLTNVTRCLPSEERLPIQREVRACAPYLLREIEIIHPMVVCPLGNLALRILLRKNVPILQYHGKAIPTQHYFLFPMIHPAAALRRSDYLPLIKKDFQDLKIFLESNPTLKPPPGQESLF
jgi:DNA polymerase